jgi:Reverse transcriptase (RNA-dependent DNA polymerase)
MSPFFFNFSIATLSESLKDFPTVKVIFYADDIVLTSMDLNDLKSALQFIKEYLLARKLELNLGKCKIMKFRNKGRGRYKLTDKLELDGVNFEFVTEFTYVWGWYFNHQVFHSTNTSIKRFVLHYWPLIVSHNYSPCQLKPQLS